MKTKFVLLWCAVSLSISPYVQAKSTNGSITASILEQSHRFFLFQDPVVVHAVLGSVLLGIGCGLMGAFLLVRKLALMGDAISHAVLPGVVLGFLWNMSKDPLAILIGAVLSGLIGSMLIGWIRETTKLKEDTAQGIILASFFAIGLFLMSIIQQISGGNKAGLDKYLFGQAAALTQTDVLVIGTVTLLSLLAIVLFYRPLLCSSFDSGFASSIGIPTGLISHVVLGMLAFSIVVALQAVGVVLVAAMLIIPAATAYLLTIRMHHMLVLSALFGAFSGLVGCFGSFLGNQLPTGPLMVLSSGSLFVIVFLFAPSQGLVNRYWAKKSNRARIQRENTLKAIYQVLEERNFSSEDFSLEELAQKRKKTWEEIRGDIDGLRRHGYVEFLDNSDACVFTPAGWKRACEIVRNHRIWELYLTHSAHLDVDHVHDDAEQIEHVLGEKTVRQIEKLLNHARHDPHGKRIPGAEDIIQGAPSQVLKMKQSQTSDSKTGNV